jgi:exodeoxyribonuclease V alpha subunit
MQGSQVERIIVPIYATRLLGPSWLYTAITRAERQTVLVGAMGELQEALARPWSAEKRVVGFNWTRRATGAASNGPKGVRA